MIAHHTEADGTLVIRASPSEDRREVSRAVEIAEKAAAHFGLTLGLLLGNQRGAAASEARQMAMRLTCEQTNINRCALGRLYNGRCCSTVKYALDRCADAIRLEPAYARRYEALRAAVLEDGKEARSA